MATANVYTAAYRTLALPELLALILKSQTEVSSLASCMRVSSLWAQEAVKILWQNCGYQLQPIEYIRAPVVRDLAALSYRPDRLQWYANCIRSLTFHIEGFDRNDVPLKEFGDRDEAQYHSKLAKTEFPHLESITFSSSDRCHLYNKSSLLLQYLQPSLKSFRGFGYSCNGGAILSDQFFNSMKNRCQSLEVLELMLYTEHLSNTKAVSKQVFAQFLHDMKYLSTLSIRQGFDDVMSSEAFRYLVQCQHLSHLDLPNIPERWIRDLDPSVVPYGVLLSNITTFSAGLSDRGLELLLPYLRNVEDLQIRPSGQFIHAFSIVANAQLTALEHLSLDCVPDTMVRGEDLIRLAETARRLEYLYLPANRDEMDRLPSATRVTDAVIEDLASHLPNLKELCLKMEGASLTEASLISLGEHCKHLDCCHISADISFEEMVCKSRPGLFPVLEELSIIQPVSDRGAMRYKDIQQTAKKFLLAFPKLQGLCQSSVGLSDSDEEFYIEATDLILLRNAWLRNRS